MKNIETYKGIEIWEDEKDTKLPFTTIKNNVPVIGCLQTGHKTLEEARTYIDQTTKITTKEWATMGYEKANEILSPMPLLERLEALLNAPQSMTPYEYWIKKSKAELMQWYMNALTTCSCGGHWKGQRNEEAVNEYLELMKKYNVPVPPNEICHILGVFNGTGSC